MRKLSFVEWIYYMEANDTLAKAILPRPAFSSSEHNSEVNYLLLLKWSMSRGFWGRDKPRYTGLAFVSRSNDLSLNPDNRRVVRVRLKLNFNVGYQKFDLLLIVFSNPSQDIFIMVILTSAISLQFLNIEMLKCNYTLHYRSTSCIGTV